MKKEIVTGACVLQSVDIAATQTHKRHRPRVSVEFESRQRCTVGRTYAQQARNCRGDDAHIDRRVYFLRLYIRRKYKCLSLIHI